MQSTNKIIRYIMGYSNRYSAERTNVWMDSYKTLLNRVDMRSGEEVAEGFFDFGHFVDGDGEAGGVDSFKVVGRDYDRCHAEFFGFGDALLDSCHLTYFA